MTNKDDSYLWTDECSEQIAAPKDHVVVTINKRPNVALEILWGIFALLAGIVMTCAIAVISMAMYVAPFLIVIWAAGKVWGHW